MIRLHVTTEGSTELGFVKQVLVSHLASFNVSVDGRSVLTSKNNRAGREFRGGLVRYLKAKNDIQSWLKQNSQSDCRFTTMFDLYNLPNDFPGYDKAVQLSEPYARIDVLEQAFAEDINDSRFIPYLQLHEFESLILADPAKLDWEYMEHDKAIQALVDMVGNQNPELINGGYDTAPSRRIEKQIDGYDKVTAGVAVVKRIGLAVLRQKCRHFDAWLTQLEKLG